MDRARRAGRTALVVFVMVTVPRIHRSLPASLIAVALATLVSELAGLHVLLHVIEIEVLQRHRALQLAQAAAFLASHCGLPGELQHASYIASWLTALRNDKRLIFTASSMLSARISI